MSRRRCQAEPPPRRPSPRPAGPAAEPGRRPPSGHLSPRMAFSETEAMGHIDAANGGLASPCDPATRLTCHLFRMGPAGPRAWELRGRARGRGVPAAFFVCNVMTPVSHDILGRVFEPIPGSARSHFTVSRRRVHFALKRGRRRSAAAHV